MQHFKKLILLLLCFLLFLHTIHLYACKDENVVGGQDVVTSNQINYWSLQEQQRANRAQEALKGTANEISKVGAEASKTTAEAREKDAETNRLNAKVNAIGLALTGTQGLSNMLQNTIRGDATGFSQIMKNLGLGFGFGG